MRKRPKFCVAWLHSTKIYEPSDTQQHVARVIGGTVAANINSPTTPWKNTCAVRLSYVLNNSGLPIPYQANRTVSGADRRWYFYRVKDLIAHLSRNWGAPDIVAPYPSANQETLKGRQGIVLFEVAGWTDAGGHATLWDGRRYYDHCYFNGTGAGYRTERANYWYLPW